MNIQLTMDVPVEAKHGMTKGRILEVKSVVEKEEGVRGAEKAYWVAGEGEDVKIWEHEAEETTKKVPTKRYLVTDPCYVVPDKEWSDYCDLWYGGGDPNKSASDYAIAGKGRIIDVDNTSYGDGEWKVAPRKSFMADAGMVCIVELEDGYKPTNYEGTAITDSKEEAEHWYSFVTCSEESDIRKWER